MTIVYHAADAALANRLQKDMNKEINGENNLIVILSPTAANDSTIQNALFQANDQNKRIVPVMARETALPSLIEHLEPVDFTKDYNLDALIGRMTAPTDALHLKVRTPAVNSSNRRAAYVIAAIVFVMFLGGIYLVGVMGIQAPAEEFNNVETEIIQTRDYYVDSVLPRTTEDALNFQATVDAARPTLRPILIATATAVAGQ